MKQCNGVFEGGGVRGIGHVGAACGMEQAGYQFVDLAGSSAGAIVAALLAAGYTCRELKAEMKSLDYMQFKGKDFVDYFGTIGKVFSILLSLGIYNTDYLEQWLDQMLQHKRMTTFADVKRKGRSLKITASDLTDKRLLILPDDLEDFGIDPDSFRIASAVRMSVSIPVFFEPVRLRDRWGREHMIVDGGLLSNYPVWILDDGRSLPVRPTFGFKFTDDAEQKPCAGAESVKENRRIYSARINIVDYLKSIVATCLDAIDNSQISPGDYERTVRIATVMGADENSRRISAVDFGISKEESAALFENGRQAAEQFLSTWNFESWKRKYR